MNLDNEFVYDDDDDFLDFDEKPSVLQNVGSLELAPVEEEQAPSFSDTLQQQIDSGAHTKIKTLDADDKRGIEVKGVLNKLTNYCEAHSRRRGFTFQSEVEPAHIEVKLTNFERVSTALIDECCRVDTLSSLLLSTHMEFGDFVLRVTGFLSGEPEKAPRHLAKNLLQTARRLGMKLDYRYKAGSQVAYDIVVSLEQPEA